MYTCCEVDSRANVEEKGPKDKENRAMPRERPIEEVAVSKESACLCSQLMF